MMSIAITGASGFLGRAAIAAITKIAGSHKVMALLRDPQKLAATGLAARMFDYDRVDTLQPALTDVDTLVFISSSEIGKRIAQHSNVIAAARAAGVGRIIYTSLLHADTSPLSVAAEHIASETLLKQSGAQITILRNGWYTENYIGSVKGALEHGALIGSSGNGKISSASRADYADALAVVATTDGHVGQQYELAGDDAFTLTDLAAEISRRAKKAIPYHDLPEAEFAAVLARAGVPDDFAHVLAGWEIGASRGALYDSGRQLSALIGRATTPMSVTIDSVFE